ncbi:MAG: hypothetical protein HFI63_06075 [Lachnospiraceae bacterium]|nr:hypothetical protein [Lachnospiraceae bacterium]
MSLERAEKRKRMQNVGKADRRNRKHGTERDREEAENTELERVKRLGNGIWERCRRYKNMERIQKMRGTQKKQVQ